MKNPTSIEQIRARAARAAMREHALVYREEIHPENFRTMGGRFTTNTARAVAYIKLAISCRNRALALEAQTIAALILVLFMVAGCDLPPDNKPAAAQKATPPPEPPGPTVTTEGSVTLRGPYMTACVWVHFIEKDGAKFAVAVGHECVSITQIKP